MCICLIHFAVQQNLKDFKANYIPIIFKNIFTKATALKRFEWVKINIYHLKYAQDFAL